MVFKMKEPMNTLPKTQKHQRANYVTDDERWLAVIEKDKTADGKFFYSVKTTGVFCLPSCPSRPALRKNVAFYDTLENAEQAGFRACKRCWPKGPTLAEEQAVAVAKICRLIEAAEETPPLESLAKSAGMSRYHFHRVFKTLVGVTPKVYAMAHRSQRVREKLSRRSSVTAAIYDAGFRSNSRFYEKSSETLGMTPTNFRNGGADTTIRFAVGECSLGSVLVAASEKGVCAIAFGEDPNALVKNLQDQFPKALLIGGDKTFELTVARVIGFIEAPQTGLDLPLDVRGTAFQQKVWRALREIPVGSTVSYTEIAHRIGAPKAVRAVASACGSNTIAVAIPCHRVLRRNGDLSGYRWGVQRKSALIKREFESARHRH